MHLFDVGDWIMSNYVSIVHLAGANPQISPRVSNYHHVWSYWGDLGRRERAGKVTDTTKSSQRGESLWWLDLNVGHW